MGKWRAYEEDESLACEGAVGAAANDGAAASGSEPDGVAASCTKGGSTKPSADARARKADERTVEAARPRLWSGVFVLLILLTFCCFLTSQGMNAGTAVYVTELGGTAAYAGFLMAIFSVSAATTRLFVGPLIDRGRRIVVMVFGAAVLFIGALGPALVGGSMPLTVFRCLQGVGFSAAVAASSTAAADVLPMQRLGEGLGYAGLGQALAMTVGPALALFLVSTDPPENLYWCFSAVAAIGLCIAFFCRYESNPQKLPETSAYRLRWERERAEREVAAAAGETPAVGEKAATATGSAREGKAPAERGLRRVFEPRALSGAIPVFMMSPVFGFVISFASLYGLSIGVENAGLFFTITAISMILMRISSRAYMDRVAPLKIFGVAAVCGIVTFALFLAAPSNLVLFNAAGAFYGVCLGVSMPVAQSVAVKSSPSHRWGATNALFLFMMDVGFGLGTALWGTLNDAFGFPVTLWCVMGCIVVAFVLACFTFPKRA